MNLAITIDGGAGAGKSVLAQTIAKRLSLFYLNTGAFYRIITLFIIKNQKKPQDISLKDLDISVKNTKNGVFKIYLNGSDVSDKLYTPEIDNTVSEIAIIEKIRGIAHHLQRAAVKNISFIAEGRDTGTVIFPEAGLKIYLDAMPEIRAKRRYLQYKEKKIEKTFDEVLSNIKKRDMIDSTRVRDPLKIPEGAILFDNSYLSIAEEVEILLPIILSYKETM